MERQTGESRKALRFDPLEFRVTYLLVLATVLIVGPFGLSSCLEDGDDGVAGSSGAGGNSGTSAVENEDGNPDPLSSVVALSLTDAGTTGASNIAQYVKALVNSHTAGGLPAGTEFPLNNLATDTIRSIRGLSANVVAKWLDPIGFSNAGRVHLINDLPGAAGTVAMAETVTNSGFSVSGMSGGADATATLQAKAARGSIQCVRGALLGDGQTFTIDDGPGTAVVFEFDSNAAVTVGNIAVAFTAADSVNQVARAIVAAVNAQADADPLVNPPIDTLQVTASLEPLFGANCDYIAFFGDGWDAVAGAPPQWNGSGTSGWLWVNHEYISTGAPNNSPSSAGGGLAPYGQPFTVAKNMFQRGILDADPAVNASWTAGRVDAYIREYKRQMGGSWIHIIKDPSTGAWMLDRSAANLRYDATDQTRFLLTGATLAAGPDHDDLNNPLAPGVLVGTLANCSGGVSPWGTVFTGEENPQDYFGDFEACWTSANQFVAGQGYDPGGNVTGSGPAGAPSASGEFGLITNAAERHNRDVYSWLVEVDPGRPPSEHYNKVTPGYGHRKMGAFGRIRWENTAFVTNTSWQLTAGQRIVMYGGDDRRAGRVFKWVSGANYTAGMTRTQIRALLDTGELYVGHLAGVNNADGWSRAAVPGTAFTDTTAGAGTWIRMSTASTDLCPNAGSGGLPMGTTVGAALANNTYNGIGAFPTNDAVLRSLFTACAKIGIFELNRPEDVEWNPVDRLLYIALTNFASAPPALNNLGVLTAAQANRTDRVGRIWVFREANQADPAASTTFTFWEVWGGTAGTGTFDAANPDNLVIDKDGGVWFGTDGNFGTSGGRADAYYYLDLNPAHKAGAAGVVNASFGKAFRFMAVPSDAEATGPALSADMKTFFSGVQHPGESFYSTWP